MKEISQKIGQRIKEAREEKGITQKDLGTYLGYSTMGISYFEQGLRELKISDIQKLATFFGKDLSYFLSLGTTMFRADKSSGYDDDISKSLEAFDSFVMKQRK